MARSRPPQSFQGDGGVTASTCARYFKECLHFLSCHKYLYDLKMTEIFVRKQWEQVPIEVCVKFCEHVVKIFTAVSMCSVKLLVVILSIETLVLVKRSMTFTYSSM